MNRDVIHFVKLQNSPRLRRIYLSPCDECDDILFFNLGDNLFDLVGNDRHAVVAQQALPQICRGHLDRSVHSPPQ